jgi:hypothetical protein
VLRILWVIPAVLAGASAGSQPVPVKLSAPIVFTQLPPASSPAGYGRGGHLVLLSPEGTTRVLTRDFESAADPEVSFDGKRVLFAGRKTAADHWNIYEMAADGSGVRQFTRGLGDCRSPVYQSALFYLNDARPIYQVTFVSTAAGEYNEHGAALASNLYSVRLDGSEVRRLTYTASSSFDPFQMPDGRILFSSWHGARVNLFGINLDGTDYAAFSGEQGRRIQQMACTTAKRMVVFIEGEQASWDGGGTVSTLSLRRNLHSYRALTGPADGLYHSPSPLPDGAVLISRRPAAGAGTHGIYRLDPETGRAQLVFADPRFHSIQAKLVAPRNEPDGRSSVVEESEPNATLYCLSVYTTDFADPTWMPPGSVKRLRVLEGVPRTTAAVRPPLLHRRLLGEIDLDPDGSFQIQVPANLPIQLQALDSDGIALRSSAWIWAKNRENRGCIGCHEDGERTPENVMAQALTHPAVKLTLAPERRRTVDFRRDIMPILAARCASCHAAAPLPLISAQPAYKSLLAHVQPDRARTSPLVWRIYGRNTSRPWDGVAAVAVSPMPPAGSPPLSAEEKRAIAEWIDLGAHWDALPPGGQR